MKHPNTIIGGGGGLVGGEAVVEILNAFGVHVTAPLGVLIGSAVGATLLFIGRNGLRGVWRAIVDGVGGGR